MRFQCLALLPLESTTTPLLLIDISEPGAGCLTSAQKYVHSAKSCEVLNVKMTSLGLRLLILEAAYLARLLRDFVPVLPQF